MTSSNHILAGSLVATYFSSPWTVLPLAFMSHFALDALPHFGNTNVKLNAKQKYRKYLAVEILGLFGILLLLSTGKYGLNLLTLAGFFAVLPDLEHPIRYLVFARRGIDPPETLTYKFHKRIQWAERERFIVVEILLFILGFAIFQSMR